MALVAAQNFRSPERVLLNLSPTAVMSTRDLPPAQMRGLLQYQAAETNRWLYSIWDSVQIGLAALFFFFLLFGSQEGKISLALSLAMLLLTLLEWLYLTPEITALGRLTDFLPAAAPSPDRSKLWVMEGGYKLVEVLKWAAGTGLFASFLVVRLRDAGQDLNVVNKADHRHVNR